MRAYRIYGCDGDGIIFPQYENFRFRAVKIYADLHLCEWCLRSRKHCYESRGYHNQRNWKKYRKTQWKSKPIK